MLKVGIRSYQFYGSFAKLHYKEVEVDLQHVKLMILNMLKMYFSLSIYQRVCIYFIESI